MKINWHSWQMNTLKGSAILLTSIISLSYASRQPPVECLVITLASAYTMLVAMTYMEQMIDKTVILAIRCMRPGDQI